MLDIDLLNLFLAKTNIPSPLFILLKESQDGVFQPVFSPGGNQPDRIPNIPTFDHDLFIQDAERKCTDLWLKYPEQKTILVVFPEDTPLDHYSVNMLYHLLLPESIFKAPDRHETPLESIAASLVESSTGFDFDNMIQKILEKTISIVMADAGMLWVYDNKINKLVCKAYKGSVTDLASSLRLDLGEGLIGKTFLRGTPKLYSSYDDVLPDIEDFSSENKTKVVSIFGERKMDSTYLMPIFVNQQIECILIVYRFKGNLQFSVSDIENLKIFAELIEITMTNARSLITLQSQLDILVNCNNLYSKLTSLSVNNSGITNIVKELQKSLGSSLLVIDLITHEQFPRGAAFEKEFLAKLMQASIKKNESFQIESEKRPEKYSAHPIYVENSCLGYLVTGTTENESPSDQMLLEIGKMVIALELSKSKSMLDLYFKRTAQNFFELINLTNPLDLAKKSVEMGIDQSADNAIVELMIPNDNNEKQASLVYRLIAQLKKELAGTQKIIFSTDNKIIALVSAHSTNGRNLVQQQIFDIVHQAQKDLAISIYAGMGSFYSGVKDIDKSYREGDNALLYQLSRNNPGLLKYAEMGVNQLFINLTSEEASTFLSKIFTPLSEKSKQAESLETTLITYIEENCSILQTAKKLYIHPNTLYQRLKKIEASLQISLKKPEDILQIQLACYLRRIYPDIYKSI